LALVHIGSVQSKRSVAAPSPNTITGYNRSGSGCDKSGSESLQARWEPCCSSALTDEVELYSACLMKLAPRLGLLPQPDAAQWLVSGA
jgi:hypothetical protein